MVKTDEVTLQVAQAVGVPARFMPLWVLALPALAVVGIMVLGRRH